MLTDALFETPKCERLMVLFCLSVNVHVIGGRRHGNFCKSQATELILCGHLSILRDSRTPWTRDQPVTRSLPTHRTHN
jgi:hypothetical protein